MSSGFPGGYPDLFNVNGGGGVGRSMQSMMNTNNVNVNSNAYNNYNYNTFQGSYRNPLAGILSDPSSQIGLRRPDLIGKRSLAEFQQQQQLQQAAVCLRNVKPRSYLQHSSPISPLSPMDFSPEVSSLSGNSSSSSSSVARYGVPILQQLRPQNFNLGSGNFNGLMGSHHLNRIQNQNQSLPGVSLPNLAAKRAPANQETDKKMLNRLQELEKQLLLDDEDGENDAVSVVTNSEWSETIQNLLVPGQTTQKPETIVSLSPTTSSSSSCSSAPAAVCPKQLISDAASAISDGKPDSALEIITRLTQVSNARVTPEQRLNFFVASALRSRVNPTATEQSSPASELYGKDHLLSTQLLYDKSPCFKLAFMAANSTILEAASGTGQKIHVLDFDIGQGVQYVYLLHEIAAARVGEKEKPISLKLTTFGDFGNGSAEKLMLVGDKLKALSNNLGVCFSFKVLSLKLSDLNADALEVEMGEVLAVNLAFKLYKLPDESVTTENLRDELLRRVKGLSPSLVTVVEQEMNANTASFTTRVNEACGYYGALLESLDSTIPRESPERVRIEEGLSRRLVNSVACEGRDRVERCEVFGKWRARMRMAGFEPRPLSQTISDSLLAKLNSGTRGNPGFTVKEDAGGISFGWMGRSLTVASAWL